MIGTFYFLTQVMVMNVYFINKMLSCVLMFMEFSLSILYSVIIKIKANVS